MTKLLIFRGFIVRIGAMKDKKSERPEIPEELERQAGMLAREMMKMPPMSQEEIDEEWRDRDEEE